MKKIVSTLLLLILLGGFANSQNIRLNLYSAYVFEDRFDSYYDQYNYYDGQIQGGYQWGGGLEFMAKPAYGVELLYYREDTHAPTEYYNGKIVYSDLDLGLNYIMLGGVRYIQKPGGMVEGFGGLMAGMLVASITNPDTNGNTTPTKFAWGIRGGANIWASEKVAIKLQIQLLSAVQSMGGGLYFGTGGVGAGVSSYSSIYQFGLGGGLTFALGK
ncbi:MAG: hypothetical protein K1X61_05015 [Chitinophagales bacterium]|nr:hypothetical protein [Chitinophagales bacterium]